MSELYELPDGWEWKNILTIADINNKTITPNENMFYKYIGLENIESDTGRLIDYSETNGAEIKSSKVHFLNGSVLYGKLRPYLNKVMVAPFDGIVTTEILPINPNKNVLNGMFLSYFL